MKMKKTILSFIVVSFILCGIAYVQPCFADRYDRDRDGRHGGRLGGAHACQHDVRKDISKANSVVNHGIKTRQIDNREADRLRHQIRGVENNLNRSVSDGRLTPNECNNLKNQVRGVYRHIRHDMHDDGRPVGVRPAPARPAPVRPAVRPAPVRPAVRPAPVRPAPVQPAVSKDCQNDVRKDLSKARKVLDHAIYTNQVNDDEANYMRQRIRQLEGVLNNSLSAGKLDHRECQRIQKQTRDLYKHIKHDIYD